MAFSANARVANPFESVLRAVSIGVRGLYLRPQGQILVGGVVMHPDLVDPDLGVVAEGDSYEFHTTPEQIRIDCRRYTAMSLDGWLVLRFCYDDAMYRREAVHQAYVDAVAFRRHTPFRQTNDHNSALLRHRARS